MFLTKVIFTIVAGVLHIQDTQVSSAELQQTKIVGGSQVTKNELPYQVAIYFQAGLFGCSGAILDEYHVITSATCADGILDYDISAVIVKAGDHSLGNVDSTEQVSNVTKVIKHPGFSAYRMTNDVAVIEIIQKFNFNAAVKPLPLAPSGHRASGKAVLSGWGAYTDEGPISDILLKATSEIITDTICRRSYEMTEITDSMICTKSLNSDVDTCDRDSGSPIVCYDIESKTGEIYPYLCGLVSWGTGCGTTGYPAVHTEVAYFTNWILQFATNAAVVTVL